MTASTDIPAADLEPRALLRAFHRALDQSYFRLRERARASWENLPEVDPTDACVNVSVRSRPRVSSLN